MKSLFRQSWSVLAVAGAAIATPSLLSAQSAPPFLSPRVLAIYQADGSLQCQASEGTSTEMVAKELTKQGVKVLTMEKRKLPLAIPAECGTPTATVNFFEVQVNDMSSVEFKVGAAGAFTLWQYEESTLVVSIRDGATVCNSGGRSLADTKAMLHSDGITPVEAFVAKNSPVTTTFCGTPNGDTHVFRIRAADLLTAKKSKYVENASRTAEACRDVVAPMQGSLDSARFSAPTPLALIIPKPEIVPKQLKGKSIQVTFLLSSRGGVDSVWFEPSPPPGSDTKLVKSLREYRWKPGVIDGCYVAGTATVIFSWGGHAES